MKPLKVKMAVPKMFSAVFFGMVIALAIMADHSRAEIAVLEQTVSQLFSHPLSK